MKFLSWIAPVLLLRCFAGVEADVATQATPPEPDSSSSSQATSSAQPNVPVQVVQSESTPLPETKPLSAAPPQKPAPISIPKPEPAKPLPPLAPELRPGQQEVLAKALVKDGVGDEEDEQWRYLLYLPDGYFDSATEEWPLLLYLHGRSIRGDDLQRVKRYGPPSFLDRRKDFPFVVVSPQLPPDGNWNGRAVHKLLDEITAKYRIDEDRICLTGVSLGGGGSWYVAATDSERFACLAPLCGYGGTSLGAKLTDLPIWAFHGAKDDIVPLDPHQALVDAVNEAGGNAKMTVYPEGDHGSIITPTYRNQELWDWMLRQRASD